MKIEFNAQDVVRTNGNEIVLVMQAETWTNIRQTLLFIAEQEKRLGTKDNHEFAKGILALERELNNSVVTEEEV